MKWEKGSRGDGMGASYFQKQNRRKECSEHTLYLIDKSARKEWLNWRGISSHWVSFPKLRAHPKHHCLEILSHFCLKI